MAATLAGVNFITTTTVVVAKAGTTKTNTIKAQSLNNPWRKVNPGYTGGRMSVRANMSEPKTDIHEKVTESVQSAKEICAEDPVGGECAAAWDEVEEVSAAASDQRLKEKNADPLEAYCKDNPETDECRTYED